MINKILTKFIGTDKKDKVILKNVIFSFIIKAMAIILVLVKIPMYMKYFKNSEILGIWFTILSILTWIFNFDLGIGNGLRNKLVKPIEDKNFKEIKKYVSAAYISIFIVIIIIGMFGFLIISVVNWNEFFNTTSNLISNLIFEKTMTIILIGLLIQFFLKLVYSIFYSMQKAFYPGLINFISELSLLVIILLLNNDVSLDKKLLSIAIYYSLCMIIPLLISNIILFATKFKKSIPSIKSFSFRYAKSILIIGGLFFWIQIMYMIIVNTNEYLITWFVGPKYVVEYQVYNKIFSLIGTLFTLLLNPMWSMVTKALNNNDYLWIKNLYSRLKRISFFAMLCEFLLILFLQNLINIWLGNDSIDINYSYAILFAISGSLLIWNGVISTIVNGMGKLKVQFIFMTFTRR